MRDTGECHLGGTIWLERVGMAVIDAGIAVVEPTLLTWILVPVARVFSTHVNSGGARFLRPSDQTGLLGHPKIREGIQGTHPSVGKD